MPLSEGTFSSKGRIEKGRGANSMDFAVGQTQVSILAFITCWPGDLGLL